MFLRSIETRAFDFIVRVGCELRARWILFFFAPGRRERQRAFAGRFESVLLSLSLSLAVETVFAFLRVQINLWKMIFSSSRRSLNSFRISHIKHRFDIENRVYSPFVLFSSLSHKKQTRRLSPSRDVLSKKSVSTPS